MGAFNPGETHASRDWSLAKNRSRPFLGAQLHSHAQVVRQSGIQPGSILSSLKLYVTRENRPELFISHLLFEEQFLSNLLCLKYFLFRDPRKGFGKTYSYLLLYIYAVG